MVLPRGVVDGHLSVIVDLWDCALCIHAGFLYACVLCVYACRVHVCFVCVKRGQSWYALIVQSEEVSRVGCVIGCCGVLSVECFVNAFVVFMVLLRCSNVS